MPDIFAAAAADVIAPRGRSRASSSFEGGSYNRTNEDWNPWTFSPTQEIRHVLRFMRARARQLVRDNDYASGFIRSLSDNVIGPNGVMLQAKVKNLQGQLATATNKEIERGFKDWGAPETASVDGKDSWIDIQRLYIETMATDGEVLIRRHRGFDNAYSYALQFLDADLLDETYNVPAGPTTNEIRMGVELDRFNRPIAYWIWSQYSGDMTGRERKRERVPAAEIIHDFVRYRPNQTRGMTWFAPVMTSLHHLDGYSKAELMATRAAAGKMGFILNKQQEAIQAFEWNEKNRRTMDVTPGLIDELLPGQEFVSFDPTHPGTNYDMFSSAVLQAVARGLNVSLLTMTGDLRKANYSSMRAGFGPERDHWRALHIFVADHFHRPVYRDWLAMSLLAGALRVDSRLASNYYEVLFKGRGWQYVDPTKDLEALKLGIDLGVDNRQDACAELGTDYEENVEKLAYEEEFAEAAGVDVSGNQLAGLNPARVSPEGQQEDAAEPDEPDESQDSSDSKNRPSRSFKEAREYRLRVAKVARYNLAARRSVAATAGDIS